MPSFVVAHMEYDLTSQTLRIWYVSGMVYDYKNVPEDVYLALKTSRSKGTYLNQHIKGHYAFKKALS
ncbi:MAG TPA: KTSC domain-containing protein [Chitinophagaceae bacterium]|nr:KTSC domain-containing protein [Chitinophagaceae bacterium]